MAKFQIFKDHRNEFRFHLKADNGETILTSEGYKEMAGANNGVNSVKTNAPIEARFTKLTSADSKFYFNLRAANNEIIGTSEMYNSAGNRDEGIKDVQRLAPNAQVVDKTT